MFLSAAKLKKGQRLTEGVLDNLIDDMTRRHQEKINQLRNLFEAIGGPSVFELAIEVMGNEMNAGEWLTSGQRGLKGAVPAIVALEPEGCEAVLTYLRQIDYGVYV